MVRVEIKMDLWVRSNGKILARWDRGRWGDGEREIKDMKKQKRLCI